MKGGPEYVKKSLTYGWFSCVSWVSLAGIGPLFLAIGTDESLYPDTLLLRERALAEGVDLEFIEKRAWPICSCLRQSPKPNP
jgi:hypothetical protein